MAGTDLQVLYDRFFSKIDEDLTGREEQVFNLVGSAIAKSYKTVRHSLEYTLTDPEEYEGCFADNLDDDEVELLALWMLYEWNRKRQQKLIGQKNQIGTKDFNRLENAPDKLRVINYTMAQIMNDINALKNEFYTYKYT